MKLANQLTCPARYTWAMPPDRSDDTRPLHEADPHWLDQLLSGMFWLVLAILGSIAFAIITTAISVRLTLHAWQRSGGIGTELAELTPAWLTIATALGIALLSALFLLGTWRATAPEPGQPGPAPSLAMTRWTCVPAFAINIPASLMLLVIGNLPLAIAALAIKLVALSLLSVGFPASLIYLRHLARRIPAPGLARQTTIVFWGQFAAGLLLIACLVAALLITLAQYAQNPATADGFDAGPMLLAVLAPGVLAIVGFFVWWVVLMLLYHRRFKQVHAAASDTRSASTG